MASAVVLAALALKVRTARIGALPTLITDFAGTFSIRDDHVRAPGR